MPLFINPKRLIEECGANKGARIKNILLSTAIAILFLIAVLAWAVASPVGSSPDEDFHQTMLYCTAGKTDQCFTNGERYGHCFSMRPTVSGDCNNYKKLTTPKATQVDEERTMPLYYKFMKKFVGETLGETTLSVRIANGFIAIFIAVLSVTLTSPKYRNIFIYTLIICSVPVGMFFISSINPTSWSIILVAASIGPMFSLCLNLLNKNHKTHAAINEHYVNILRFIFLWIVITLGVGSRFETMMWFPIVAIFGILSNISLDKFHKPKSREFFIWTFLLLLTAFMLRFAFVSKVHEDIGTGLTLLADNFLTWRTVEKSLNTLLGVLALTGIPGAELGTHDVPMPSIVSFLTSVVIGGTIIFGLSRSSRRHVVVFFTLILMVWGITAVLWSMVSWDVHQPRYFIPVLYLIVFLSLTGVGEPSFSKEKRVWAQIMICTFVAYSLALLSTELRFLHGLTYQMTRYPLGKEAIDINPARLFESLHPEWWLADLSFLNPFSVWMLGSLCFLTAIVLFVSQMSHHPQKNIHVD